MTGGAGTYHDLNRLRLLATLPVLLAAVITTGRNYLVSLSLIDDTTGDWQSNLMMSWVGPGGNYGMPVIIVAGLIHLLPVLVISLITVGVWERIFAVARQRAFNPACVVIAILFTLLSHPAIPLFQVVFGLSFAMVFAYGVFGGDGRTFLPPALVAIIVVQVSFPGALKDHPIWTGLNGHDGTNLLAAFHEQGTAALQWSGIGWWDAFLGGAQGLMGATAMPAILLGAAILIYAGLASLRLLAGIVLGVIVASLLGQWLGAGNPQAGVLLFPWYWHLVTGSLAFAAIFIATDPAASSSTNAGRWIQGMLIGLLVVLLRLVNPGHADIIYSVLLLICILAPVIDHGVAWFNIRKRMRAYEY